MRFSDASGLIHLRIPNLHSQTQLLALINPDKLLMSGRLFSPTGSVTNCRFRRLTFRWFSW